MSMELIRQAPTMVTQTCSSSASMSTTMRLPVWIRTFLYYAGPIYSRKRNVALWRPSVRLSVCPVGTYST